MEKYYISLSDRMSTILYDTEQTTFEGICEVIYNMMLKDNNQPLYIVNKKDIDDDDLAVDIYKYFIAGFLLYDDKKELYIWYEEAEYQYYGYEIHSAKDLVIIASHQVDIIPVDIRFKDEYVYTAESGSFICIEESL